jgi:hypothetical protein
LLFRHLKIFNTHAFAWLERGGKIVLFRFSRTWAIQAAALTVMTLALQGCGGAATRELSTHDAKSIRSVGRNQRQSYGQQRRSGHDNADRSYDDNSELELFPDDNL